MLSTCLISKSPAFCLPVDGLHVFMERVFWYNIFEKKKKEKEEEAISNVQ